MSIRSDGTKLIAIDAANAVPVTPNNTTDLPTKPTKGLYVGVSGDVVVTLSDMADETSVKFPGLSAGMIHPMSVKRVWATGTTATSILAAY